MAIHQLKPSFKDYLWGGQKLKEDYGKDTDLNPLAESWEVSTHPDGPSYIVGGEYDGQTLEDYINAKGKEVLGKNGAKFDRFPVLIKFIDALKDLSIQVHPDDEYGLKHENEYGKTEMWYILEAAPSSKIYYGTNQEISKEDFKDAINNQEVLEKLKHVEVFPGDVIFVEAGTIHAIGEGIVLCEVQQNSNTTYRVYDYHRKDADGNLRDLHVEKALDVSTLTPLNSDFKAFGDWEEGENHRKQLLAESSHFITSKVEVDGSFTYDLSDESFEAIILIDGTITLKEEGQVLELIKGQSAFIDAGSEAIQISGKGSYLTVRV